MSATLNYHRCHGTDCEGKHPAKTFTSESEERRKGWKRCHCPIVASGTLNRKAKRKATKEIEWAAAAAMMAPYIAANSWELPDEPPPPPPAPKAPTPPEAPASTPGKVTIETATKAYLGAHEKAESAGTTIDGYRHRMASIRKFANETGWIYLNDWNPAIVSRYLDQFKVAPITIRNYRKNLIAFFSWCIGQESMGITVNPAKPPKTISNRKSNEIKAGKERQPFVEAELDRMYQGCLRYDSLVPLRKWKGEDLADFIAISVHTGLRISDVATFHIDRLNDDEVRIRTLKRGKMVYTVVPPWLAQRIRNRAEKYGPRIFGDHRSTKLDVATHSWRERLRELWRQCGNWDLKPTPHRFRHTFVYILLKTGRSYADCADLTGDTEQVIREHYASWVKGRQERISKLLRESFADVPVPAYVKSPGKVIPMIKHG